MGTAESIQRSSEYLERRQMEKEEDRRFRNALAAIAIAGGILAWGAWQIVTLL